MKLHRFSLDLPEDIYTSLKIKSALTKQSIKDIIIACVKPNLKMEEEAEEIAFINASSKTFAKEWNSPEDDKAYTHFQKYSKRKHK